MEDIQIKIKTNVADAFMKQRTINVRGTEVSVVELLETTLQIRPNNQETEEFSITFKGQVSDGYGGFIVNSYRSIVSAKITDNANVESINIISVTNY